MNYDRNPGEHVTAAFWIGKKLISAQALRRKKEEKEKRKARTCRQWPCRFGVVKQAARVPKLKQKRVVTTYQCINTAIPYRKPNGKGQTCK